MFKPHSHKYYEPAHSLDAEDWRKVTVFLFALISILYIWGNNLYGLFDVDEAIFTEATVEMMESGNYIGPTYNAEPRYHKPPLIYWVQAAVFSFTGEVTPFFARLPSVIFGLLSTFTFYALTLAMTNRQRFTLTATAVLGLSLSWLVVVRGATADSALNFFMLSSAMLLLWIIYNRKYALKWQVLAGVLLALGLLTKGPIALFTPGIAAGLAFIFRPNIVTNFKVANPFIIAGVMLVGILPWVAFIIQQSGIDFFKEFIMVHNIGRFADGLGNTHSNSGWYYLIVFAVGFFPWSALFFSAIFWVWKDWFKNLRSENAIKALPVIGFIWCVVVVTFFSFSSTKLPHYIVPALPGAALLIAGWIEALPLTRSKIFTYFFGWPLTVALGLVFLLLNVFLMAARPNMADSIYAKIVNLIGIEWPITSQPTADVLAQTISLNIAAPAIGILLLIGGLMGFSAIRKGFRQGIALLIITQFMFLSLLTVGVVPLVYKYMQQPLANLGDYIAENHNSKQVYYFGLHKPSVRLVSGVQFKEIHKMAQLENKLPSNFLMLLEENRLKDVTTALPENYETEKVCKGGYCVLDISSN